MDELQNIQNLIYVIRGQRVMIDFDLAMLYEVETRSLNQTVKRNIRRFPRDFMFQLTDRAQLDAISTALAELQAKPSETKSRKPIGFIQSEDDDDKK